MSDDLDPNDPIVGFLRSTDPGDPPVTLGPGSSLRHRAAVRHARRQAVGAVLAVGLIGVAVVGSVVGTRHHANVTTANHTNIASPSISTRADQSPFPSRSASATPSNVSTEIVSAAAPTEATETVKPNNQSATPAVPTLGSASFRSPGPIAVGEAVFFTVRYTAQGSYTPGWSSVDFGDGSAVASESSCPATSVVAPTSSGSGALAGEISTPSHTYTAPGTYVVHITIGFACIAGSETRVVDRSIVVTGPAPSTSVPPSSPASASTSPSPSTSPSAPGPGSATPTP